MMFYIFKALLISVAILTFFTGADAGRPRQPTSILVYSYMRGGSTYTSSVLKSISNRTVYWFEPLESIYASFLSEPNPPMTMHPLKTTHDANGNKRPTPSAERRFVLKQLMKFYTCEISELPLFALLNMDRRRNNMAFNQCVQNQQVNSNTLKGCGYETLRNCSTEWPSKAVECNTAAINKLFSGSKIQLPGTDPQCLSRVEGAYRACAELLDKECVDADLRIVKVIRGEPWLAREIMSQIPDLDLIHLTRDPRSILSSRYTNYGLMTFPFDLETEIVCSKIRSNIMMIHELQNKYPDRVHQVSYTRLMTDIQSVAGNLLDDLGVPNIEHVISKSHNMTDNGKPAAFNVRRDYGTFRPDTWKQKLQDSQIKILERECGPLLTEQFL